jgi:hypothetical protein
VSWGTRRHAAARSTEAATSNQRQASSPDARYLYSRNRCTAIGPWEEEALAL